MSMETLRLSLSQINEGAKLLKEGQVIGFPTETVYGLGVIYDEEKAYKDLMEVKRRPPQKPFTLMCADLEDINKYAKTDERILKFLSNFMPGALTVLLPKKDNLPYFVTLGSDFIGIRISSFEFVRDLIRLTGKPLLVPSANKAGEPPLSFYEDVIKEFDEDIAAIYIEDAKGEKPSTIIKIEQENVYLIREGSISFQEIERKWKEK